MYLKASWGPSSAGAIGCAASGSGSGSTSADSSTRSSAACTSRSSSPCPLAPRLRSHIEYDVLEEG